MAEERSEMLAQGIEGCPWRRDVLGDMESLRKRGWTNEVEVAVTGSLVRGNTGSRRLVAEREIEGSSNTVQIGRVRKWLWLELLLLTVFVTERLCWPSGTFEVADDDDDDDDDELVVWDVGWTPLPLKPITTGLDSGRSDPGHECSACGEKVGRRVASDSSRNHSASVVKKRDEA